MAGRPNIFEYHDFRSFLNDFYIYKKKSDRKFSYREFARRAKLKSPSFFKMVVEGERKLSVESIQKFIYGLELSPKEAGCFENLVLFNQASTIKLKNHFFERLKALSAKSDIRELANDQYELFSNWYHLAIRELVEFPGFKNDPEWIAASLVPRITPHQAKEGIELLLRLKLLKKGPGGRLKQSEANLSSAMEVQSLALMNFHDQMMGLAKRSLEELPHRERDISSVTLGMDEKKLPKIRKMVHEFQERLLREVSDGRKPQNRVFQLNLQLFPLTQNKV